MRTRTGRPVLFFVLALSFIAGCSSTQSSQSAESSVRAPPVPLACPAGGVLALDSTVEGKDTWWVCRRDGRPDGPSLMTYADGKPRNMGTYAAGKMHGRWTHWSQDGQVEADGFWVDGERDGRWTWRDGNGTRIDEYAKGKPVGRFTRSYADGTIAEQGDYVEGAKVGRWRTWNAKGGLESEEEYVKGEKHGLSRRFHPNGTVASSEEFAHDQPVGKVRTFFENGAKETEGDYVDGEASERWTSWDASGKILSEGPMVKGKRHGDWRIGNTTVHFENGREGHLRPCPAGSRERIECVARCCDVSARWCETPDGKRVGPFDSWTVDGRLIKPNKGSASADSPGPP